ncbi:MAG: TonB-dependent receptor plug domain-containing protein, partial [Kiritimatiellia bacterium]
MSTGTGAGFPSRSVLSVNGLPPQYTLVLVDGVPLLTDHIHTGVNVDHIPPSTIERIEIMRGAASAQYGTDAIGGIVNLVTRRASDKPEGTLQVHWDSQNTYEGNLTVLTPVGNNVRVSSFFSWEQSDGPDIKAPPNRIGQMGYERMNLLARLDATPAEGTRVVSWLNWVRNRMDWTPDRADSHFVSPALELAQEWTVSVETVARLSYSEWQADVNSERNTLWKPEVFARWTPSPGQTLMIGADYAHNEFERNKVLPHEQDAYGVFVQQESALHDVVTMVTALRYDKPEKLDAAWSPKISLLVTPLDAVRLRASVGRGFHAPTLQERYEEGYGHGGRALRFGNPELEPEYSTTYTLGLELQPAESVQLLLYGYYSELDNMVVPVYRGPWEKDPTKDVWMRQNIKDAVVYGGEAELRVYVTKRTRLSFGYTHTENEDQETGRKLPYSPGSTLFGQASSSFDLGKDVTLSGFVGVRGAFNREAWNWKPAADMPPDDPTGLTYKLSDYTLVDAGLTATIGKRYEAFVKVANVFGKEVEHLDDAWMIIEGDPVFQVGLKYNMPLGR